MSEPVYKVGKEIKVYYQAPGATTGLTIKMEVYDEGQVLSPLTTDAPPGQSVAAMTEIGATGRYRAFFTPDAQGDWHVQLFDSVNDTGKVIRHYQIGGHDVDDIGDTTGLIKAQTDLLPGDPASQTSVDAKIDASEASLKAELDALKSPAQIG